MRALLFAMMVITGPLVLVGCGDDDKCNVSSHEPSCVPATDAATNG